VPLDSGFYARPAPLVARELLGQVLELRRAGRVLAATITETEAYLGAGDAASHSHRGPTPRSSIMFGPPGVAYVYLIYGVYHCLNVVTEPEGVGSAVLIRALEPMVTGGRPVPGWTRRSLVGPGRLCREFGVDLRMNGWDLTRSSLRVLGGSQVAEADIVIGPRVGINRSADLPLRFRVLRSLRS
jgi:DNA-3-methyladenine glycosylase